MGVWTLFEAAVIVCVIGTVGVFWLAVSVVGAVVSGVRELLTIR